MLQAFFVLFGLSSQILDTFVALCCAPFITQKGFFLFGFGRHFHYQHVLRIVGGEHEMAQFVGFNLFSEIEPRFFHIGAFGQFFLVESLTVFLKYFGCSDFGRHLALCR